MIVFVDAKVDTRIPSTLKQSPSIFRQALKSIQQISITSREVKSPGRCLILDRVLNPLGIEANDAWFTYWQLRKINLRRWKDITIMAIDIAITGRPIEQRQIELAAIDLQFRHAW